MMMGNKLCLSPAAEDKNLKRVLDAGCGTGIWSMEFGESRLYPLEEYHTCSNMHGTDTLCYSG